MVDAEEELSLREVHHQRNEVFTASLDFNVVALRDSVDSQVHLASTGHLHSHFLAQEKIGIFA